MPADTVMGAFSVSRSTSAFGTEFFAPLPLLAVLVFGLNNLFLKAAWPGVVSGKLSDLAVCFFLPLFVSACLDGLVGCRLGVRTRLSFGAAVTLLVFGAVKISPECSALFTHLLNEMTNWSGLPPSSNRADPTDLVALPCIGLAYWYGRGKESSRNGLSQHSSTPD